MVVAWETKCEGSKEIKRGARNERDSGHFWNFVTVIWRVCLKLAFRLSEFWVDNKTLIFRNSLNEAVDLYHGTTREVQKRILKIKNR